jgi:metal-responsive CopG/Arc/MetJ family transcriptional regulator
MLDELNEVLKETEQKRSEVLRNCLREYINKNKISK